MQQGHDIESIFTQALDLVDPALRTGFLDEACQGAPGVRNRVLALLQADSRAGEFMNESAAAIPLADVQLADDQFEGYLDDQILREVGMVTTGLDQVPAMLHQPGQTIGRYRLVEQIGEGGMGVVFQARQTDPISRDVALKIIKPGRDTKEVVARFELERQALALMDHENIARVLDAGATPDGRPFFVMELVRDGQSITDYCDQAQLSMPARLRLIICVCDALQHAHQKGILHRDIKPRNVMVSHSASDAIPKVIDFGIAKAIQGPLTDRSQLTQNGEFVGTPAYMSPEQAGVTPENVDTRSDVYSLGALLYELLVGRPPFDAERLRTMSCEQVRRVLQDESPPHPSAALSTLALKQGGTVAESRRTSLKQLRELVHGELDWIVMRAMEKDRARRYQSVGELAQDITRYLAGDPVLARAPSRTYRLKKFVLRHRAAVAMATTLLSVLVLATVVSAWWARKATRADARSQALLVQERWARSAAEAASAEAIRFRDLAEAHSRETAAALEQVAIEAQSLQEVNDFLNQGILWQANPVAEADRDVRVITLLDRAVVQLDSQTFSRPEVEAEIRTTIGEAYRGLGRYDQARNQLQRALDVQQRIHPLIPVPVEPPDQGNSDKETGNGKTNDTSQLPLHNHLQAMQGKTATIAAANRVVTVLLHQGRFQEVQPLLQLCLENTSQLDRADETRLTVLSLQAWWLEAKDDLDQAEQILREVLQLRREAQRTDDRRTWLAIHNLAHLCQSQGKLAEAELLYRDALNEFTTSEQTWRPEMLTVASSLASLYLAQGKLDQAASLYEQALAPARTVLGEDHDQTLAIRSGRALVEFRRGDLKRAELQLVEVLEAQRTALGNRHPQVLATLHNLGLLFARTGRDAQASELFIEELAGRVAAFGNAHRSTISARSDLAFFYLQRDDWTLAREHYVILADLLNGTADIQDRVTAQTLLGLCQFELGEFAQAETSLARADSDCQAELADHWLHYIVKSLRGEVLWNLHPSKAEPGHSQAEQLLLEGHQGLTTHAAQIPPMWEPLGVRAAARRLAEFYAESKE